MIPPLAKAFLIRRRITPPRVALAAALAAGLVMATLVPAARGENREPGGHWALTVFDEQGQPLQGAVLLGTPSRTSPAQHDASDAGTMSPLIIDQRNKRFVPFVSISSPQRPVSFPNSDDVRHHVYSFSAGNVFERKLYRANEAAPVIFATSGVVALGCNIHDNMQAYVLVTEEPVAGPSDARGVIRVTGRAPAADTATLPLWHPLLNTTGEAVVVPLTLAAGKASVTLPMTWSDPQQPRSSGDLEALLRQFSRENP